MEFNLTCLNGTYVNCTGNMTCTPCIDDDDDTGPPTIWAKIRFICYIISFLLSLIGNGCVILVTLKKFYRKEKVSAFKMLITHLAFVDFLFSCNSFVLIQNELENTEADDGIPMCTFKRLLRQVPFEAALGTIVVIAVERYRGIARDFSQRKWTLKRVFLSLFVVWVFSFAVYMPGTVSIKTRRGDIDCYEALSLTSRKIYAVFLLLVEYVLPLCVIGFCNYKIIKVIKGRNSIQLQVDDREERDKEQRKTVRILVAIVLGFAILALPNQIFFGYLEFGNKRESFSELWDILQTLGILMLLHTSYNAALYSIMDDKFRQDAKMLFCCAGKNPRKDSASTTNSSTGTKVSKCEMVEVHTAVGKTAV